MSPRRTKRKKLGSAPYAAESAVDVSATLPLPQTSSACEVVRNSADADTNPSQAGTKTSQVVRKLSFTSGGNSERTTLWLRRADQFLMGLLLIALLGLLVALRWKLSGGGRAEIEIASQQPREYFYAIDVNRASWVEWAQLDGIGEKLARRVVQEREQRGPFRSIDDVCRVRGLGPKLIEKLRPFLKCIDDGFPSPP